LKQAESPADRASRRALGSLGHGVFARIRELPLALLAACALYVALRWWIVDTSFDQVALWMYETYPMGTLAELAIRGVEFPLRFYYDNAAGQILAGYLTVPSFLVLGPSYLALKLVPFVLGFGTLILLHAFLRANFGRRAANLGAFLFTLGPPTLVKYSVICSGNHFENLFFSLLAVACFYRLHAQPENRGRLFASAFTAGLALFVFLGALIPVGILAGMHVGLRGLRRALRDLPIALAAFALGILPLVALNALTSGRAFGFLNAKFSDEIVSAHGGVLERTWEFVAVHLPKAGVFEPLFGLSGPALGTIFFVAFVLAYAVCVPGAARGVTALVRGITRSRSSPSEHARDFERVKLVPFVLCLPLAALAYGLSNFRIGGHAAPIEVAGYRYFLPHFLFAIVLLAVVAARAWEHGGSRKIGGALLAAVALACGLSNFELIDASYSHAHLGRYYEGYDLSKLARGLLSARNGLGAEEIVERLESFPVPIRQNVACAIGFNVATSHVKARRDASRASSRPESWSIDLDALVSVYPEDLRLDVARGAGVALRFDAVMRDRPMDELAARLEALPGAASGNGRAIWRAACEGACAPNPALPLESQSERVLAGNRALIELARGASKEALARGQGRLCGRLVRRGIPSDLARVHATWAELADPERAAFSVGYGSGLAEGGEGPAVSAAMLDLAEGSYQSKIWLGFGASLRRLYGKNAAQIAAAFESGLEGAARAELENGLSGKDEL
jgi:hypothetical protein